MWVEAALIIITISATVAAVWCLWEDYKDRREYRLNNRYLRDRYKQRRNKNA